MRKCRVGFGIFLSSFILGFGVIVSGFIFLRGLLMFSRCLGINGWISVMLIVSVLFFFFGCFKCFL